MKTNAGIATVLVVAVIAVLLNVLLIALVANATVHPGSCTDAKHGSDWEAPTPHTPDPLLS